MGKLAMHLNNLHGDMEYLYILYWYDNPVAEGIQPIVAEEKNTKQDNG